MGFFTWIKTALNNQYDRKLSRGLARLNMKEKLAYNPDLSQIQLNYMTSKRRTEKLTEWHIWYMGDEYLIRNYFLNRRHTSSILGENVNMNLFWEKAPANYVMVHSGWPGILSHKMSEILWSNGYTIDIEVFKKEKGEDGTEKIGEKINEKESARIHDLLVDVLLKETKFNELLGQMAEDQSWSGHVATKLSFDRSITPYPIVEAADARLFEIIKERRHTTGIKFKTWENKGETGSQKKYRLDEIYTTVRTADELVYFNQYKFNASNKTLEIGDAVIQYQLYEIKESKETAIPFANWQALGLEMTSGILQESIAFPGLKGMLAFECPNILPNPEFPGSPYGASDYARICGSFDKADELYSENAREVRDNKSMQAIPSSWMPKDSEGKMLMRDPFRTNVVFEDFDLDQAQGTQPELQTSVIADKTESILGKWKIEVSQICMNAKISPVSLGMYGFESLNASDKSQQEREKQTIETRKYKITTWKPFIESILLKLLEFNSYLREAFGSSLIQPGIDAMDIDFSNCNVKVSWPDYIKSSQQERLAMWGAAKASRIADTQTAVEGAYPEKTREEQLDIVSRIRFEEGVSTDNPNALQLDNLLGNDGTGGVKE